MAQSQRVSRPGNEQYLRIEHDGETYEAEKVSYQKDVDGELVTVEEYRLEDEDVPAEVVAEVDRANGADQEDVDADRGDDQCAYVKDDGTRCELPAGDDGYCHLEAHTEGN